MSGVYFASASLPLFVSVRPDEVMNTIAALLLYLDSVDTDAWLPNRADLPLLGPVLELPMTPWIFSYGGLALDLFAWPALAFRRTRAVALLLLFSFHLLNATLFNIGIFPWMMLAATTVFLEPDWPRRFVGRGAAELAPVAAAAAPPTPGADRGLPAFARFNLCRVQRCRLVVRRVNQQPRIIYLGHRQRRRQGQRRSGNSGG